MVGFEPEQKPAVTAIELLIDTLEKTEEESRERKEVYRMALKEIRNALCEVKLFSRDTDKQREEACQTINEILEVFGI